MPRGTRDAPRARQDFAYGAITRYGRPFQDRSTRLELFDSPTSLHGGLTAPHNPENATRAGFDTFSVWALSRSLAATEEIEVSFFS